MSNNKGIYPTNAQYQTPQRPGGASGIPIERPNRNIATPPPPTPGRGDVPGLRSTEQVDRNLSSSTFFTPIGAISTGTPIIYNGDRLWAKVTLTLETAGPVAVGQQSNLFPVLGGSGILLQTGVPFSWDVGKGTKLYIAATAVNRVSVLIQAYPWVEQIMAGVDNIQQLLTALARK